MLNKKETLSFVIKVAELQTNLLSHWFLFFTTILHCRQNTWRAVPQLLCTYDTTIFPSSLCASHLKGKLYRCCYGYIIPGTFLCDKKVCIWSLVVRSASYYSSFVTVWLIWFKRHWLVSSFHSGSFPLCGSSFVSTNYVMVSSKP